MDVSGGEDIPEISPPPGGLELCQVGVPEGYVEAKEDKCFTAIPPQHQSRLGFPQNENPAKLLPSMKIQQLLGLSLIFIAGSMILAGQNSFPLRGNVAIGTTNPLTALHIPNTGLQIGNSTNAEENFHVATEAVIPHAAMRTFVGNYGTGRFLSTLTAEGNFGLSSFIPSNRLDVFTYSNFGWVRIYGDQGKEGFVAESKFTPTFQAGHYGGVTSVRSPSRFGDVLGKFQAGGFDGVVQRHDEAGIVMVASEDHSPTHHGARMEFHTTPAGEMNRTNAPQMTIESNGYVGIGTVNPSHSLTVNGAIGMQGRGGIHFPDGSSIHTASGLLDPVPVQVEVKSTGSSTFKVPDGVQRIRFRVWGGGGGGFPSKSGGSGGGGGAFAQYVVRNANPGDIYELLVGAGGGLGSAGGTSKVTRRGEALALALAAGGEAGQQSRGGLGGVASQGQILVPGEPGQRWSPQSGSPGYGGEPGARTALTYGKFGSGGDGQDPENNIPATAGRPGYILIEY